MSGWKYTHKSVDGYSLPELTYKVIWAANFAEFREFNRASVNVAIELIETSEMPVRESSIEAVKTALYNYYLETINPIEPDTAGAFADLKGAWDTLIGDMIAVSKDQYAFEYDQESAE